MPVYKTPNVYVEEISTLPPSVAPVATAIPAFIGYTAEPGDDFAYRNQPVRISSMLDYTRIFGGADDTEFAVTTVGDDSSEKLASVEATLSSAKTPKYLLYYSLRLFFSNGGGSCYVVSVGQYGSSLSKSNFEAGIEAIAKEDEPTLLLLTDAANLSSSSSYYSLCQDLLKQCNKLKDRFAIFDVLASDDDTTRGIGANFREGIQTSYLKYGAAYYPYLQTSLTYQYSDESVTIQGPAADDGTPADSVSLASIKTDKTELYNSIKTALEGMSVVMPPSTAIAGIYAKTDRERGVWKAPANVSLASVIAPTVKLTNDEQENLNVDPTAGKSINAIRSFTGKGTLVWGARTLAGNDNEWRYISVRRLFNLIEESVQKATSFVVFESNNAITWLKVKTLIETYLEGLWRQGAMAGASEKEAFFVRLGLGQTMTEQDILEGRMKVEIGISAVRPAEFIVLQFSHKLQQG